MEKFILRQTNLGVLISATDTDGDSLSYGLSGSAAGGSVSLSGSMARSLVDLINYDGAKNFLTTFSPNFAEQPVIPQDRLNPNCYTPGFEPRDDEAYYQWSHGIGAVGASSNVGDFPGSLELKKLNKVDR